MKLYGIEMIGWDYNDEYYYATGGGEVLETLYALKSDADIERVRLDNLARKEYDEESFESPEEYENATFYTVVEFEFNDKEIGVPQI